MKAVAMGLLAVLALGPAAPLKAQDSFDFSGELRKSIDILPLRDIESYRKNVSDWDAIVRGFRRDHNFSLVGGLSQSRWQLGKIEPTRSEERARGYYYRIQYHYHIRIVDHFGYYLGSSAMATPYEFFKHDEKYYVERSFSIPGLSLGLVYDFSSIFRALVGAEGHLQRIEHLEYRGSEAPPRKATITARVFGAYVAFDLFYQLGWALRLEGAWRHYSYKPPADAAQYAVDLDLSKIETLVGLGLVYHLI